ncbi:MAG: glycosyltransferase [Planctomycetota bacterium]
MSLEEWFHGGALSRVVLSKHWDRFESRIDRSVDEALAVLDRYGARATFFVLGVLADRNPGIVGRIARAGHEVASRGYWPRGVAGMTADEFAEDLDRTAAAIAAAGGGAVRGFRSPRWLQRQDLWIFEVLAKKGYVYDASINPVGWSFAGRREFHTVRRHDLAVGGSLVEVPVSTTSVGGFRVAIAGGNWMRQLPHALLSRAVARWHRQRRDPLVFYLTSWELDPEQPQITAASRWSSVRQYRNLGRTRWCLEQYLQRYRFESIAEHLGLPRVDAPGPRAAPHVDGATPSAPAAPSPPPQAAERTTVSLVVPMFNEEDNIQYLLRTLSTVATRAGDGLRLQLVLVDDCSRDRTWEVLKHACAGRVDVQLLRHEQNRGVAAAIMTGIRAAQSEIVCTIDCDCSYDPMDLLQMVPMLGDADMVTASPYHPQGQVLNVPRWRLLLSRTLSWIYRRLLRVELHTWTSCFRVLRRSRVVDLELQHGGFLGVAELLVRVLRRGGVVREYPTLLESRLLGVSKMKTLRTIRGHLGLLWQVVRGRVR